MKLAALALALLSACIIDGPESGPAVVGSPTDVVTIPGDHGGYRVVLTCANAWNDAGVIGTGSVAVTGNDAIGAAGQDLHARVSDIASISSWGGASLACESGVGTQLSLSSWRDVDTVIARTGAWLVEHDYSLQVSISVGSVPVAQSD